MSKSCPRSVQEVVLQLSELFFSCFGVVLEVALMCSGVVLDLSKNYSKVVLKLSSSCPRVVLLLCKLSYSIPIDVLVVFALAKSC